MLTYRYPYIAREGWGWIAAFFIAAVIAYLIYGYASFPLWCLTLLFLFLFRDPLRKVPALPLAVICPVDGRVVAVGKVHDGYLDREAICVTIRMSIASVYSVHSPMEGKIMEQWMEAPRKIQPITLENRQHTANSNVITYAQWIQSDEGDDVVMVMEASRLVPRPRCYAHSGERIGQGQRCGFLRFGSQVDVLLSGSSRIEVTVGDYVNGGSGIIGTLVRDSQTQELPVETIES